MMRIVFAICVLFAVLLSVSPSQAALGIDISVELCAGSSLSDFQCLVQNGYTFAIIEAWQGPGGYGTSTPQCLSWAIEAGMQWADVYMFFCSQCALNGDPGEAIKTTVTNLRNAGASWSNLWFDIEQCDGCWGSPSEVCSYLGTAVQAAEDLGISIGFYSSEGEWPMTAGASCTVGSSYPLWYAHYDGVPNFSDGPEFYQFGGWTAPTMKQYDDSGPCMSVDVNYYPGTTPPTSGTSTPGTALGTSSSSGDSSAGGSSSGGSSAGGGSSSGGSSDGGSSSGGGSSDGGGSSAGGGSSDGGSSGGGSSDGGSGASTSAASTTSASGFLLNPMY